MKARHHHSGDKGKGGLQQEKYYEEAQAWYLINKDLQTIASLVNLPVETIERWHREGHWEEKKEQAKSSPRWLAEALKGLWREKTLRLLSQGDLKPAEVEELNKIALLIERMLGQAWDLKAAALEVMDRFCDFIRQRVDDPEEIKRFAGWLWEFYQELEEDH